MRNGKPPPNGKGTGNGAGNGHPPETSEPRPPAAAAPGAPKPARRQILCPKCGKLTVWEGNPSRPFCSERCRLMDLGQWADGSYAIPAEKVPDKGEDEE